MALIRGSIVLLRLIKGNVKNLQVSDSGPLWPSCSRMGETPCPPWNCTCIHYWGHVIQIKMGFQNSKFIIWERSGSVVV